MSSIQFCGKQYLNKFTKVCFKCFEQVTSCVHSSCHNNENNMSDSNTTSCGTSCLQGNNTCRVFENQVCQWLSIQIRHILERLSLQLTKSSLNYKQKVRTFVIIKCLAAKVQLCFFKYTIQQQLSTKYTAKINFVSTGT